MAETKQRRQRPGGKWYGFMGVAFALMVVVYGGYALLSGSEDKGAAQLTSGAPRGSPDNQGKPSSNYRDLRTEQDKKEAKLASETGTSFVPSMLGKPSGGPEKVDSGSDGDGNQSADQGDGDTGPSNEELLAMAGAGNNDNADEGDRNSGDGNANQNGQGDGNQDDNQATADDILPGPKGGRAEAIASKMKEQFSQIDQYANSHGTMTTKVYDDVYAGKASANAGQKQAKSGGEEPVFSGESSDNSNADGGEAGNSGQQQADTPPDITRTAISPGEMIYAVNDLRLNSDSPTPVRATVLSGEFKDARLLGEFERAGEFLVVTFNRMQHKGQIYSMNGVAVDPSIPQAMVRSSVDHHGFVKWATFLSANFIGGLGNAFEQSGKSISTTTGNGRTTVEQAASYTAEQKAWIAAGKTASEAAKNLKPNIDRPPTVTLEPETPIGVLILESQAPESGGTNGSSE